MELERGDLIPQFSAKMTNENGLSKQQYRKAFVDMEVDSGVLSKDPGIMPDSGSLVDSAIASKILISVGQNQGNGKGGLKMGYGMIADLIQILYWASVGRRLMR
ncbi:hypothetical protein QYF36_019814 [Acer negundo]|nr:hypothetical protein QYF36_019814 [Acer negundo]